MFWPPNRPTTATSLMCTMCTGRMACPKQHPQPDTEGMCLQVHRARLWSGEEVVVKVQRPGLKPLFDIDLKNLRALAVQLDKGEDSTSDFLPIWQECSDVLFKEIDYILEGRNADRHVEH